MQLAKSANPGQAPEPVRALSRIESGLLRRHLLGTLSETDLPEAAKLLAEVHAGPFWILCDCAGPVDAPTMHTRSNSAGTVALVRNPHRPNHVPGCVFAEGLSDLYTNPPELRQSAEAVLGSLLRLSGAVSLFDPDKATPDARPSLWSALKGFDQHAREVRDSAGPLGGYFTVKPQGVGAVAAQLRAAKAERGWAVLPLVDVSRGALVPSVPKGVDVGPITVRGPIDLAFEADARTTLLLASVRLSRGTDGRYEPTYALVLPILPGGNPIPAGTRSIRDALVFVRTVCAHLRKLGVPVAATVVHGKGLTELPSVHLRPLQTGTVPVTVHVRLSSADQAPEGQLYLDASAATAALQDETRAFVQSYAKLVLSRIAP